MPVIDDDDTWPSPETVDVHAAYGLSNPPAAMLIEKWIDELESDPVSVPRPLTPVPVSVIVTVPDSDASVCVTTHTICPGPDESDAAPRQVPVMLTGADGDGAVGVVEAGGVDVDEDPPPLQAAVDTSATTIIHRRLVIIGVPEGR